MQFQKSTDYAIRILHYLHNHIPRGDAPTAQTISEAVGVTYPYFIKIANLLKRRELITSVQGRNGGYRIAKSACKISVYDVVLAVEGELKINHCLEVGKPCDKGAGQCTMQAYFREIREGLIEKLSSQYITDFGLICSREKSLQRNG